MIGELGKLFLLAILTVTDITVPNIKTVAPKMGYRLDFADEFNEDELDRTRWTDYYLPHWCSDLSLCKGNYRFEDGCLVQYIDKDQKPWCPELDGGIKSSAIMSFDKSWIHNFSGTSKSNERETWYGYKTKYGYFELRAKLADCGGGGHQAWWMVGMQQDTDNWFDSQETAEIDVLETFFDRSDTWRIATYGWNDPNFQTRWQCSEEPVPFGNPTEEFHTYAMEWSPSNLKFYYDGELVQMIFDSPNYEMGTILNIYTDAGSGTHNDVWPKEWYLDYYRVWKPVGGYDDSSPGIYYLKNNGTGGYIYQDPVNKTIQCGKIPEGNEAFAEWKIEQRGDYVRIRNKKTHGYMQLESADGILLCGDMPEKSESAQWKVEVKNDYVRFTNCLYPESRIHIQKISGSEQVFDRWTIIE